MAKESEPPQRTPWAYVVRGGDSENAFQTDDDAEGGLDQEAQNETLIPAQAQDDANVGRSKRPVWNRPNNDGAVEAGGSVMGGSVSWPALSESARTGGSRQVVADGSVSGSSLQAPILSPPPQRPANKNNNHSTSTGNNTASNRQRSRNHRGGGGGGGGNSSGVGHQGSFNRSSAPITPETASPFPVYDGGYVIVPPAVDVPMRSPRPAGGGGGPQPHMGSDHPSPSQRNNSRRGNYNPRPRGDGSFHNNHSNRRDQDRREVHTPLPPPYIHPHAVGFMPPTAQLAPAGAAPFMAPPSPMRVYVGPYDIPQAYYYVSPVPQEALRATMPPSPTPLHPPPAVYLGANENSLPNLIVNQISFYFSDNNLARDEFLKSNMDVHGWVPISLIATFNRVQLLTSDIQVITDALRNSTFLEVQGDRVRRRNDWSKWCKPSGLNSSVMGSQNQATSAEDGPPSTSMERLTLNDSSTSASNGEEIDVMGSSLASGGDASEAAAELKEVEKHH